MVARSPDVGEDIESICSKCGDMWHVVVAKVSDTSFKVQCKVCSRTHKHKLAGSAVAKPRKSTRKTASSARAMPAGPMVKPDESRPVHAYKISEVFRVGERLDHPTFGVGVVEEVLGPEKIQVYFTGGRKVLAQGKGPGGSAQALT